MIQMGAGEVREGLRASQGSIEGESLVGWIMRVLEMLNLLSFLYLCIFFILCRLTPLVNTLLLRHSISTFYNTCFAWRYALDLGLLVVIRSLVVYVP